MSHTIAYVTALVLIIPGIFMAFVPMLPALTYMFVVTLVYGFYDKFTTLTSSNVYILLGIVAISIISDHTSGLLGAKYGGAHTKSILWGILGAIIGTFIFPALGSFIGLFIGVMSAELYYKKTRQEAIKAAGSALIGTAIGVAINVVLALVFTVCFFIFALS
jgi:uncharacterized protein YqgC (DUF456 family)